MLDNITFFLGEVKYFLLNFLNFLYISHKMLVVLGIKKHSFSLDNTDFIDYII